MQRLLEFPASSRLLSVFPAAFEATRTSVKHMRFSLAELLDIRDRATITASAELKTRLGRLRLLRTPVWRSSVWGQSGKRKRSTRRQKRGKWAGSLAKLKASRPRIPTLFPANVRTLDSKMDLLLLTCGVSQEMRNCAVLCLTEAWLQDNMPDSAFQIDGLEFFRADRLHPTGC